VMILSIIILRIFLDAKRACQIMITKEKNIANEIMGR